MMHVSKQKILKMLNADSVRGLNVIEESPTLCDSYLTNKSTRQPFPKISKDDTPKTEILELVHSDLIGPVDIENWGESRYVFTIIDEASRYCL